MELRILMRLVARKKLTVYRSRLAVGEKRQNLRSPMRQPPTPHCMGKSAEVIDEKGVAMAPLGKRVRNRLTRKEIHQKNV